jgi:hypothetical protein
VSGSGTPPPDWGAIFHLARRRVVSRLLLLGAIGGVGAVLLLGGGLSAQGAVSLGIIGNESKSEKTHRASKDKPSDKRASTAASQQMPDAKADAEAHTSKGNAAVDPTVPKGCIEKRDSAGKEYNDEPADATGHRCPVATTNPDESNEQREPSTTTSEAVVLPSP